MTNLENGIKGAIEKKMADGTVEALIEKHLEKGIEKALEDLLSGYRGEVRTVIEDKLKETMVPYLEGYDYSKYIVKVDHVLTEVLKSSALENKKLLENFKDLMLPVEKKTILASELFNEWLKFVAEEVETDGLEIDYDDEPTYDTVRCSIEVEKEEGRSWSSIENASIILVCEHDEEMNFAIPIHRFRGIDKKGEWTIDYKTAADLSSLRSLNAFEVKLMALKQAFVKVELDIEDDEDDVRPDAEPEASFY